MVRIDRVVTRGGDGGETSLGDGARLRKDTARIEAIGAVDEANAAIGVLRACLRSGTRPAALVTDAPAADAADRAGPPAADTAERPAADTADAALARIQNDLFDLGADLAVPGEAGARLRMTDGPVLRLESEVAAMNAALPPLTSFILPGGTAAAAAAHLARTVVRRAERAAVRLAAAEAVTAAAIRYLNRLSDHLFVLGRVLNDNGAADVLWVPGAGQPAKR